MGTNTDDWQIEGSDDEKYDPMKKGNGTWCPLPEDIIKMYEALANEKILKLEWKCPGRHSTKAEKSQSDVEMKKEVRPEPIQQPKEDTKQAVSTEFDFDDDDIGTMPKVTPQRIPGNRTPRNQKKQATMEKILQDVMKQRIQNSADRDSKRRFQRSPRTPGTTPVKSPSVLTSSSPSKIPAVETASLTSVGTTNSSAITSVTNVTNKEISETNQQEMETTPSSDAQNTAIK